MTSATFGPGFLPKLREILLFVGQSISYGPDGEPTEGRNRVVCVLTAADGRDVTATIDASDFREPRRGSSRSKARIIA